MKEIHRDLIHRSWWERNKPEINPVLRITWISVVRKLKAWEKVTGRAEVEHDFCAQFITVKTEKGKWETALKEGIFPPGYSVLRKLNAFCSNFLVVIMCQYLKLSRSLSCSRQQLKNVVALEELILIFGLTYTRVKSMEYGSVCSPSVCNPWSLIAYITRMRIITLETSSSKRLKHGPRSPGVHLKPSILT